MLNDPIGKPPVPVVMKIEGRKISRRGEAGVTLTEVIVATIIGGLVMAGVANGFIQCMRQADWSAYSLAANSIALQRLEQTRSAKWDPLGAIAIDELVSNNFPTDVQALDMPTTGGNVIYATNYTTISTISTNPAMKMIRVDCVWRFLNAKQFTNTVATYRAPFQ